MGDSGYNFYMDGTRLPITPPKLTMKINNRNETASLISDVTINRLKAAGLTDISFEATFPVLTHYPFEQEAEKRTPSEWITFFEKHKAQKLPFRFIVTRSAPDGTALWDTNLQVSLEDYEEVEDAEDGSSLVISVNLKTYEDYHSDVYKTVQTSSGKTKAVATKTRTVSKVPTKKSYTVKSGDTLWLIAKKQYGDGNKWNKIYTANKTVIENTAKKHGRASSSNGWWIYPGEVLSIP
ncbi:LysM peptidoglycan-binding domain-containing protein [Caproicibacterium sp. XB1]|uniref:LysM peptidoglycan-binding domain-containing protein n=1 Tax=Caproicibacterium sp. XB1 TaxID=3396405 RepID=UPI0039B6FAC4